MARKQKPEVLAKRETAGTLARRCVRLRDACIGVYENRDIRRMGMARELADLTVAGKLTVMCEVLLELGERIELS